MPNVTINLTVPSLRVSAAWHQRIVAIAALLTASADAVTSYGPGFGLPPADGVYIGSGVILAATILRAMFPAAADAVVVPKA